MARRDESCLRPPVRSVFDLRARTETPGKSGRTGRQLLLVVSMRRSLPPRSKANLDKETTRERKEADDNARDKEGRAGEAMEEKG